jgi:uncharacterized protein (DUF58 family)
VLTSRGKDYLKATAFTIVIASIAGPAIAGALALSLAVMAGISLTLLRRSIRASRVTVGPQRLRAFKRQKASAVLRVDSLGSDFARISSISVESPFGLDCEVGRLERGAAELVFTPNFAGSFQDIKVVITIADALGLFAQRQEHELGMVVESLPISLLLNDARMFISPMVQGEYPTGGRGSGQELYGVEAYSSGSDAKDLMWKRAARSGGESMQVRIREASAKAAVTMLLLLNSTSFEDQVRRVDLASEALAQLGKNLVSLGVRVELVRPNSGGSTHVGATNVNQLAAAIVSAGSMMSQGTDAKAGTGGADLLVIGPEQLDDERIRKAMERTPSLVIWDAGKRAGSGGMMFAFTGDEDLTLLAEMLLER